MSLMLDLSPNEERAVIGRAASEGISPTEYVRRLLAPFPTDSGVIGKPLNVMQFAGIVPLPDEEIDAQIAEIEAGRDEGNPHEEQTARLDSGTGL